MNLIKKWRLANLTLFVLLLPYYGNSAPQFGPRTEAEVEAKKTQKTTKSYSKPKYTYTGPKLDIVIPIFDPGLPADEKKWEESGIWPELRRAESVRVAIKIRESIKDLGIFGNVVVSPDGSASGDLYVMGKIVDSNGEDLRLSIEVFDTTGKTWVKKKTVKHRVPGYWHEDPRNKGLDPFESVYTDVAGLIVKALTIQGKRHDKIEKRNEKYRATGKESKVKITDLQKLNYIKELLFARSMSPETYGDSVVDKRGRLSLAYLPAMDDSNWSRILSVRAVDSKVASLIGGNYDNLVEEMNGPYAIWQKDAYPLAKEYREAKQAANAAAVIGIIGALAGAAAAANSGSSAGKNAGIAAMAASAALLAKSFKDREESKEQASQLDELGASVQGILAPKVIAMENKEVLLTGTASEQLKQWRTLLLELYADTQIDVDAIDIVSQKS